MLKQLVPQEVCLKCDVCCRFGEESTFWSPLFTREEQDEVLRKGVLNIGDFVPFNESNVTPLEISCCEKTASLTGYGQRIKLKKQEGGFICSCFNPQDQKCAIYSFRPFECQLYPFLLVKTDNSKYFLAGDKKCPYIKDSTNELREYLGYLKTELDSDKFMDFFDKHRELFIPYLVKEMELLFPIWIEPDAAVETLEVKR